jgi:hypothetical protein
MAAKVWSFLRECQEFLIIYFYAICAHFLRKAKGGDLRPMNFNQRAAKTCLPCNNTSSARKMLEP